MQNVQKATQPVQNTRLLANYKNLFSVLPIVL